MPRGGPEPGRDGQDDARIAFTLLSGCTAAGPGEPPLISRETFCAQVGAEAVAPELGPALWVAFWAHESAPPATGAGMPLGVFLRGIAALCADAELEALLEQLWDALAPPSLPHARLLPEQAVVEVLSRAYELDTSAPPADAEAFQCAAATAAAFGTGAAREEPALRPGRAFALWAARDLPSLAEILPAAVERAFASPDAIDAAFARNAAAAQGGQPAQLSLQELLLLDGDTVRKQLSLHAARQPAAPGAAGAEAGGAPRGPAPDGAASAAEGGGAERETALLAGDEWLWLIRLALSLRGPGSQPAALPTSARGGWTCLYSSRQHGRSLHTLVDRVSGYGDGNAGLERGQLLLCSDTGGHVFGCWADKGLEPTPGADYFGGDGCTLLRLRPSLLVCRSRRRLSRLRATPGARRAPAADGGGSVLLAASVAVARRAAGDLSCSDATRRAKPADANFCLCNNRRGQRRGVGMGGTLQQPRLWLAPSLEAGSSTSSCGTFADGVLSSAADFAVRAIEVWGCGGREARRAQLDWRGHQSDQKKQQLRGFLRSELDGSERRGVVDGLGKEDKWIVGLLNFTSSFAQRNAY